MRIFFIILTVFIINAFPAFAGEAVKISDLIFDNSDSIIYLKTTGAVDDTVTFTKGYLKEPDRIYLDINNAIFTCRKKSYTGKNSVFNSVKISQFTADPKTVRLVFEYNSKLDLPAFQIYKTKDSIFILTNKKLVQNRRLQTVYSNTKSSQRASFFQGAQMIENKVIQAADLLQNENAPKNEIAAELSMQNKVSKISSKYYINSISRTKNGVMVEGIGKLSIIPSFTLQDPERLIIDLDDTVVNPAVRNKTWPIGQIQTAVNASAETYIIDKRETITIGQNSQSIARIVIQGASAKEYRAIVSPDSKNLYLTNKANIIPAKMSANNAVLNNTNYSNSKGIETISFLFDDSVAFDVFEKNSNLYLDINNLKPYENSVIEPLTEGIPGLQTTRLALDKLRLVFPGYAQKHISLKTSPDNDEIKISIKSIAKEPAKPMAGVTLVPLAAVKNVIQSQISNLFTVVIDAGHGGNDVGATRNNIYEKDITLKIAKMVEKDLNKKNVHTYMVRDKDKTVSLAERSEFSNEKKPDVFVSVHVNSSLNDDIKGVETHWWKEDSKKYANFVHDEIAKKVKDWSTNDRGLFKSQFYVINHTDAPAILCEIGFISNKDERNEITKTKRQEEIAEAISEGVYKYLKTRK